MAAPSTVVSLAKAAGEIESTARSKLQMGAGESSWTAFAAGIKEKLGVQPQQAVSTESYGNTSAASTLRRCNTSCLHEMHFRETTGGGRQQL